MNSQKLIDDSLLVIQEVFKDFRPLLLERAGKSAHTSKGDGSPVTETDLEVETTLQRVMSERCPGVPIYGEETGYGDSLPAAFWLVDPIDGTQSFVDGIPTFTNMAVLIQAGQSVASVIYNPSSDAMYVARKDLGAFRNGIRLDLRTIPLADVAYCKSYFIDDLNAILQPKGVRCTNGPDGGGYGFTLVADGLSAARFNLHSRGFTHDYAPGSLLIHEAGGVLLPVQNDIYTYESRSFIACHPDLESVLRPHLKRIRLLESGLSN